MSNVYGVDYIDKYEINIKHITCKRLIDVYPRNSGRTLAHVLRRCSNKNDPGNKTPGICKHILHRVVLFRSSDCNARNKYMAQFGQQSLYYCICK